MSKEKEKDAKDPDVRAYDLRLLERNIKRGLVSRKDYEKFLRSLPDSKDKVASGGRPPDDE